MEAAAPGAQALGEAPPEAAGAAEEPSRRWLRVPPKAVLVPLITVVLGAWLIPAFTRQWDDRQKARDLQAAVVADIVSATTKALNDAQTASDAKVWKDAQSTVPPARINWTVAAANQWSVAALRIKVRLRIYFGPSASERWAIVSSYLTWTLFSASGAVNPFEDVIVGPEHLADLLWQYASKHDNMKELRRALLAEQDHVATMILSMHARGYSTRWRDIARDLFPFV